MAQWVNRLRIKIFVNPPPLPLSCEITPSATGSYGRQADEIQAYGRYRLLAYSCYLRVTSVCGRIRFA